MAPMNREENGYTRSGAMVGTMSDADERLDVERVLTILIVLLFVFAIAMFVLGEFLVAGVSFLSLTFAIYFRETW